MNTDTIYPDLHFQYIHEHEDVGTGMATFALFRLQEDTWLLYRAQGAGQRPFPWSFSCRCRETHLIAQFQVDWIIERAGKMMFVPHAIFQGDINCDCPIIWGGSHDFWLSTDREWSRND